MQMFLSPEKALCFC